MKIVTADVSLRSQPFRFLREKRLLFLSVEVSNASYFDTVAKDAFEASVIKIRNKL